MNEFGKSLPRNRGELWVLWTLVTAACLIVANVGAHSALEAFGTPALLGAGQWLLLRPWVKRPWWWIVATFLGLNIGIMIGGVLGGNVQDALDGIGSSPLGIAPLEPGRTLYALILGRTVAGASMGAVLGLAQWIVLRRHARHAYLWPLANIGALASSFPAAVVLHDNTEIASSIWVGALTGGALVWLLRAPVEEAALKPSVEPSDRRKRSKLLLVISGSAAALLLIGGLVYYFGTRDLRDCRSFIPERMIRGCTALLAYQWPANDQFRSEAYTGRGVAYDILRQYDTSLADLNEAIRLDPANSTAYLERGNTYLDQKETAKAIEGFGEAIRLRPGY